MDISTFEDSPNCEIYVPSTEKYGFGKEYLTTVSKSVEYSGMAPTVEWTNNVTAYQCSVNEDAMEKDAGTHTSMLTATYTGDMNFSVDIPYTYTITPAPMTLAVSDTARVYGDENPKFDFTYTGLKNGETAPTWEKEPTITTEADKQSPCGVYAVNVSGGEATNYNITQYTDGTLTINKRELTATANAEKTYGDENPDLTVTYEGFVNDDNEDAITIAPTAACEATAASGAGTYPIVLSGGEADNYTFAYEDGTLTVNKRELTATANDAERLYGEDNPELTVKYEGFVNDDTEDAINTAPTAVCEATAASGAGTYPIILNGGEDDNYTFAYTDGTLIVNKRELTATANDAERLYGEENPELTVTYEGFVNDDTEDAINTAPTAVCEATAASGAGTYPIVLSGGEADNYTFAYTDGTLTVNKRELTATANDAEKLYGEENPEFTVTYDGFVNDDTEEAISIAPTVVCEATKDSDAGTYAITVSGGEADNYTFAYENGTLTINPLTVGFKETYNSATYNDMSVSSEAEFFKFVPEIAGDYDSDDFRIEMMALDKNETHSGHTVTITEGDYAGKYVSYDGPTYAGKYIFNLTSKGTNPNVTADPSPAYLTVSATTTNLEWDAPETITVNEGDVVELGISYKADSYCNFNTAYDNEIVEIYSEASTDSEPRWYAKGLRAGETALSFAIECGENEWGFYNYNDSPSLSRTIKVAGKTGVGGATTGAIRVRTYNGSIVIDNKPEYEPCSVYDLQGKRLVTTTESVIGGLNRGVYIVVVKGRSHKIVL